MHAKVRKKTVVRVIIVFKMHKIVVLASVQSFN